MQRLTSRHTLHAAMHPSLNLVFAIAIGFFNTQTLLAFEGDCIQSESSWIQISPNDPGPGDQFRIKAISLDGALNGLALETEAGTEMLRTHSSDGPPYTLDAETQLPQTGSSKIIVFRGNAALACRKLEPGKAKLESPREWTQSMEAFYAGWIAQLFDGPPEEELSFRSLEPVLR
ncbi:MAG TPA: hypothetical protein DCY52_06585, partial [Methylococcaceae bacterium]|nr:hypothetical protein [Methylococcaceae bacterium]